VSTITEACAAIVCQAGGAAAKRNRSTVNGSRVWSAAISGVIACGLLVGGAGGIGVAVASAGPGGADDGVDHHHRGDGRGKGQWQGSHQDKGGSHLSGGKSHFGRGVGGVRGVAGAAKPATTQPLGVTSSRGGGVQPPAAIRSNPKPGSNLPGQSGSSLEPDAAAADGGAVASTAGAGLTPMPIGLPMVIISPPAVNVAVRPAAPPSGPRGPGGEAPAGREPAPAAPVFRATVPDSFRAGYPEYLRSARMAEVAGLAVPGIAGILALTAAGGLVGYRQAKAGLAVRAGGTARFLHRW
jgi:hypothetical protein